MHEETISLSLDLELSGETLTGRARDGSGGDRAFAGWLGLVGAIDALISEQHQTHTAEATDSPRTGLPKENR